MRIKDDYERKQVKGGFDWLDKQLFEAKSASSGAVFRMNFGDNGSKEVQEVHQIFKKVDKLLQQAYSELKKVEEYF
ncbi:hypothetical protein [Lactococcus protaetiae]|uniref:Uncharacterized protein n=1 Tax=Lactococcus protaetiae TaxID=2592653 RepID=A0A514Z6B4_9LACT|nr:hypothetical protein [Lactococcus protaetiae]QDK70138.1 hypothetical protein FLP15_01790 [Lactococcus protaetiae]